MLNENYFLSLYFVLVWNRFYASGHDRSPGILIGRMNASSDWSNDYTLIVGAGQGGEGAAGNCLITPTFLVIAA